MARHEFRVTIRGNCLHYEFPNGRTILWDPKLDLVRDGSDGFNELPEEDLAWFREELSD